MIVSHLISLFLFTVLNVALAHNGDTGKAPRPTTPPEAEKPAQKPKVDYACLDNSLYSWGVEKVLRGPGGLKIEKCPEADDPQPAICYPSGNVGMMNHNVLSAEGGMRDTCKRLCPKDIADQRCGDYFTSQSAANPKKRCSCTCPEGKKFCWEKNGAKFPDGYPQLPEWPGR